MDELVRCIELGLGNNATQLVIVLTQFSAARALSREGIGVSQQLVYRCTSFQHNLRVPWMVTNLQPLYQLVAELQSRTAQSPTAGMEPLKYIKQRSHDCTRQILIGHTGVEHLYPSMTMDKHNM